MNIPLWRREGGPRFLAMYLPQFHPIPENDEWWGAGFTEWTNVVKALPRFTGHYQPHLPAELGFYDLRSSETRAAQADLAASHGIDGFCYYHYWFDGRRLLDLPFDEVRRSGAPAFPFCLCWANENWTRSWDGLTTSVLVEQRYSEADDRQHGRWLASAFQDPRYITIDGRPLFLTWRASLLPDPRRTTDIWREETVRLGIPEPFLACVESVLVERRDPRAMGFDAAVEFQPDWRLVSGRLVRTAVALSRRLGIHPPEPRTLRFPYDRLVKRSMAKAPPDYIRFSCVTPSWDNSPRRRRGAAVLDGATPDRYRHWVEVVAKQTPYGVAFVNAWNEWGEGCHLEPDQRWGRAYLEAHRDAVGRVGHE